MNKELKVVGNERGIVKSEVVEAAISSVFEGEKKNYSSVTVLLVSDDAIQEVNKKYLGHDYATDVLTFLLHEDSEPIEGEIYVSLQTTNRNSKLFNSSHSDEIIRVVIHAALHLVGYEDSTSDSRKEMRKKEDFYLDLIEESLITNSE